MGDPLWPDSALALVACWGVNQQLQDSKLSNKSLRSKRWIERVEYIFVVVVVVVFLLEHPDKNPEKIVLKKSKK